MERHISKKFFAGILALSAGFVLASCDPVNAVPKNYDHAIITTTDGNIDLDGNTLGTLYDSITSERNSKIVEQILSKIAEKKFGTYADFLKVSAATATDDEKNAFADAHPEYFKTEHKLERVNAFVADINNRISEYFYNEITSGSYNDDLGRFSEKKLHSAHKYELYDLGEVAEANFKTFFVDNTLTKENAFDKLNKAAYQVAEDGKRGYIQEKVFPDILRNKLVEDYIYQNNPSTLGRAYARELSYIKVSYDNEPNFAETLMDNFALTQVEPSTLENKNINFSYLENAVKGFKPSTDATVLVAPLDAASEALYPAGAEVVKVESADVATYYTHAGITLIPEGSYKKETKLGKIIEEYQKAIKAEAEGRFPTEENKAALDSFTSDGKSKQYGLLQKLISLMKEDYTTEGWFVKNGGVSELPSAIRDRLFNIRVANSFDDGSLVLEHKADGEYTTSTMGDYEWVHDDQGAKTDKPVTRLPYLRNINGRKVILPNKALSYEKDELNYIYHDRDSKAFYICEVLEAPSTAKLNENSNVYNTEGQPIGRENISRQIAKILATKDSYIKDAYTELLNYYYKNIKFYDTSLYEYLKGEYPDLDVFEDD